MPTNPPPPPVDRDVPTPKASGSFMIFHTRALFLHIQLDAFVPHTRDTKLVFDALRAQVAVLIVECAKWPETAPEDVTERLAATTAMDQKIRVLEDQVRSFLEGGR